MQEKEKSINIIKNIIDYNSVEGWGRALRFAVRELEEKLISDNKQSTPCKFCSGAASMFGIGCYCPWCGRKIEQI